MPNKPTQKEVNEFLLDFVEFLGKHFRAYFDKAKIAGGNEGISLFIRNGKSASELEIATDGAKMVFRMGEVTRRFREEAGKEKSFAAVIGDLIAVFEDRLFTVRGYREGKFAAGAFYLDRGDADALSDFRSAHPGCDEVVLKKWIG